MINKVAIIDDDSIFQFTTKVKLEKLELANEVLIFNDGEEAIEYFKNASLEDVPEIVFLDINMPIMDGWDFLNELKSLNSDTLEKMGIHMISSSINPDDVRRAESNEHVLDYITKPISDHDLTRIFRK